MVLHQRSRRWALICYFLVTREIGDSSFDGFWEIFDNRRQMVGAGVDVERFRLLVFL